MIKDMAKIDLDEEYGCDNSFINKPKEPMIPTLSSSTPDDFRKYADDLEKYNADMNEYQQKLPEYIRESKSQLEIQVNRFQKDLMDYFGIVDTEIHDQIFSLAWEMSNLAGGMRGHTGYRQVYIYYREFSDLVKDCIEIFKKNNHS